MVTEETIRVIEVGGIYSGYIEFAAADDGYVRFPPFGDCYYK